ncbi:23S rRNA (cytidine(2498)-2'-O)-methyltransferase RlmM [Gammaproteobacteria bacterium 45_16_T64]|nr:23S rRNA (cytidine(2498)-2'-O)-methyltransferase RlmM [Gammaproteobacteria bacterium 45_16_T64]
MSFLVLYCRSGFEKDCLAEITDKAMLGGVSGYGKLEDGGGVVRFYPYGEGAAEKLTKDLSFSNLIFARQWFVATEELTDLSEQDRLGPIIEVFETLARMDVLVLEHADTNDGKQLSKFCRKFSNPARQNLRKKGLLASKKEECHDGGVRGHLFFVTGTHVIVGQSTIQNSSQWEMGVPRLKFPAAAPSRSTLKLEEAWLQLMTAEERMSFLKFGHTAVDLGAAPGGWTWQLVNKGMKVWSIDNGPMNEELMATGQVTHLRDDAFTYRPKRPVDWMVCDVVDKPAKVADRMLRWLLEGWCRYTVFNLKLPMKQRWAEVHRIFERMDEALTEKGIQYELRAKHLYHDREEITVFIRTR